MSARTRYFAPAFLIGLQLLGLYSALLGDGVLDWLAWLVLFIPLAVIGACLVRVRR